MTILMKGGSMPLPKGPSEPILRSVVCDKIHGYGHAWRAGCLETCTSGSEGGMKKPAVPKRQGASSLPYEPQAGSGGSLSIRPRRRGRVGRPAIRRPIFRLMGQVRVSAIAGARFYAVAGHGRRLAPNALLQIRTARASFLAFRIGAARNRYRRRPHPGRLVQAQVRLLAAGTDEMVALADQDSRRVASSAHVRRGPG